MNQLVRNLKKNSDREREKQDGCLENIYSWISNGLLGCYISGNFQCLYTELF